MSRIKVFVLTIDSESWLGSLIHPTHQAALQYLIDQFDLDDPADEWEARELLEEQDSSFFFCIEQKVLDTDQFEGVTE